MLFIHTTSSWPWSSMWLFGCKNKIHQLFSHQLFKLLTDTQKWQLRFGDSTFKNLTESNPWVPMQFTHLFFCDGNNNLMFEWVALNPTHEARKQRPTDFFQATYIDWADIQDWRWCSYAWTFHSLIPSYWICLIAKWNIHSTCLLQCWFMSNSIGYKNKVSILITNEVCTHRNHFFHRSCKYDQLHLCFQPSWTTGFAIIQGGLLLCST